jgi:hypothetical protein
MGFDEFGMVNPPTYLGIRYTLVIRDFYTRYTYYKILNYQTEFLSELKRFVAYVENHHNGRIGQMHKSCAARLPVRIGHMRMDRLSVHHDKLTQAYLKDRGTRPEFVGPGMVSHHQAGSLETVMYPNKRRVVVAMQYVNAPCMMWGDPYACCEHHKQPHQATGRLPNTL